MKRVLFLDDDRRRIAAFRELTRDDRIDLTVVETADECIAQLKTGRFDLVFLDHDLGGEIYCDSSREDCGMEVVRWLARNRAEHGAFIVHTHNEIAGAAMYFELKGMGHDVEHAMFGSGTFAAAVERALGRRRRSARKRRTLGERIRDYFRSLRLGR
jgi:CheY-like chemotaxis protein